MKHNFIRRLLPILLVIQTILVLASCASGDAEPKYALAKDGQGYVLESIGKNATGAVVVPATYNGLPVVEIGKEAFKMKTDLISVSIPASVRELGHSAFYGCTSLKQVTFDGDSALTKLGDWAFTGCTQLASISLPKGLTYIGCSAFSACKRIKEIVIPEGVTYVGSFAFYSCSELKSITLPDGIQTLGDSALTSTAFYNSSENWIDRVLYVNSYLIEAEKKIDGVCKIREGTKYIAEGAFKTCSRLSGVEFPQSLLEIREWAFANCSSLTRVLLPDQLTYLGDHAFYNCENLKSVRIPQNIHVIPEYAFAYCGFQAFVFSSNITEIAPNAFTGCNSLLVLLIPAGAPRVDESGNKIMDADGYQELIPGTGLKTVRKDAFSGCSSLVYIYYEGLPKHHAYLSVEPDGNETFVKSLVYYYSESEPEQTTSGGDWHYDEANYWWHYEKGTPTPW